MNTPRLSVDDLPDLATPKQVREVLSISDFQLRTLIRNRRIGHIVIGARAMIPKAAVLQFLSDNTVQPCRVEIQAPASASLRSAAPITSSGPMPGAPGAQHGHGRSRPG